ncbi:hypothetical protein BIW11_03919, partial [Tropilaelaps mercedesae]
MESASVKEAPSVIVKWFEMTYRVSLSRPSEETRG